MRAHCARAAAGTCAGRQRAAASVPRPPGTPVPATARHSAADRRTFRSARVRSASVSRCAPPVHSVTSWPVISTCTPPAQVPSAAWMSKKLRTSDRIESKLRVFSLATVEIVLPCIGSHSHTTLCAGALAPRAPAAAAARATLSCAHAADQRDAARLVRRVQHVEDAQQVVRLLRRADLHAERVLHAAQELDMRALQPGACGRRSTGNAPSSRTNRRWWNRPGSAPARTAAAAPRG